MPARSRRRIAARSQWRASMRTLSAVLAFAACSPSASVDGPPPPTASSDGGAPDGSATEAEAEAGAPDDGGDDSGLTGKCADEFGSALTEGFGRLDGVVYAVQKPSDTACVMPNKDHVVVQVLMGGAVYRMVVNVESDRGLDRRVRLAEVRSKALPAPAFGEGWHAGVTLDYAATLDAHSDDFTPFTMDELVARIADALVVGAPVSVYATSGAGRPESTHLIHRNKTDADGALVVAPRSASPTFLLFAFDGQAF